MSDQSMNSETVSLGDWIGTIILSGIPLVGFIMLLVWAFGGGTKPSKQNYARAVLIVAIIGAVVGFIFSILFAGIFAAAFSTMSDTMMSGY